MSEDQQTQAAPQEESAKPAPQLSPEQGRAALAKMFQAMHGNLGAISRMMTSQPTPEGYLMPTDQVGQAVTLLTRSMSMLERILHGFGAQVPRKPDASSAADATQTLANAGVLTPTSNAVNPLVAAANELQAMTISTISSATTRTGSLIDKHIEANKP